MRRWIRHLPLPLAVLGMVLFGLAQYFQWPNWVGVAAFTFSAIMLAIGLLAELEVVALLQRRGARFSLSMVVAIAFVLAIAISANVIAYRHYQRWDLTTTRMFSLSDQTRNVLKQIREPVRIIGFFTQDNRINERRFDDLMEEYRSYNPNLTVEKYDPTRYPTLVQQYQVTSTQMVVVATKDRFEKAQEVTERAITSALIRLLYPEKPVICYLTGHGETPLSSFETVSLRGFKQIAERENYEFREIPIFDPSRKKECQVVLIVGPRYAPRPKETEALTEFLKEEGGRVWINIEAEADEQWAKWLGSLGVHIQQDVVYDQAQMLLGSDPSVAQVTTRPGSSITAQRPTVGFVAYAQSIEARAPVSEEQTLETALETTQLSWADRDRNGRFEEDKDERGPLTIGVLVQWEPEKKEKEKKGQDKKEEKQQRKDETQSSDLVFHVQGRLAVVGDADWLTDPFLGLMGNAVIALNTLAWLSQREVLISEKKPGPIWMDLGKVLQQTGLFRVLSVFLIPGLMLALGFAMWYHRRKL